MTSKRKKTEAPRRIIDVSKSNVLSFFENLPHISCFEIQKNSAVEVKHEAMEVPSVWLPIENELETDPVEWDGDILGVEKLDNETVKNNSDNDGLSAKEQLLIMKVQNPNKYDIRKWPKYLRPPQPVNLKEMAQYDATPGKDGFHQCNICSNKYKLARYLYYHIIKEHRGINIYWCYRCGSGFEKKEEKEIHEQAFHRHYLEKLFICPYCGDRFKLIKGPNSKNCTCYGRMF